MRFLSAAGKLFSVLAYLIRIAVGKRRQAALQPEYRKRRMEMRRFP